MVAAMLVPRDRDTVGTGTLFDPVEGDAFAGQLCTEVGEIYDRGECDRVREHGEPFVKVSVNADRESIH